MHGQFNTVVALMLGIGQTWIASQKGSLKKGSFRLGTQKVVFVSLAIDFLGYGISYIRRVLISRLQVNSQLNNT